MPINVVSIVWVWMSLAVKSLPTFIKLNNQKQEERKTKKDNGRWKEIKIKWLHWFKAKREK